MPSSQEQSPSERRSFLLRKLHSLSGVVPVGAFLLFHLWTNAHALRGKAAFDEAVESITSLPYLWLIEILVLGLPLLFHALLGLVITLEARSNVRRYSWSRNWMYLLQRVSGILTLAFVGYHLYELRLQVALGKLDKSDFFPALCEGLSSTVGPGIPLLAVAYLLGIAAAVFHFTNGLYGFCFSWGITRTRRATRTASAVFSLVGLLLFALGANTVLYFATGSGLTLSRASADDPPALSCRDLGETPDARTNPSSPAQATPSPLGE